MKTKLGVIVESVAMIGLLSALYLDYSNNAFLQNYVGRTTSTILSGINVWTGAILGVTSFLATYFLLQDRSKAKSSRGVAIRLQQWTSRLRIRPRKIAKTASTVSGISLGLPSMEPPPAAIGLGEGIPVEGSKKPSSSEK
jgi:hypothetical protein